MSTIFFQARSATLHYGKPAAEGAVLKNLSFTIHQGERVALLGKSGSGKSTLLNHMRHALANESAWCPQQPALVQQLNVFHNIYCGALSRLNTFTNCRNLILPSQAIRAQITPIAEQLELTAQLWQKAGELSGGQQQRVGMGRAVFQRRHALLADEPVSSLDASQGRALLKWFLAQHSTSVIALHHVEFALNLCDRVIGLANGEIVIDAASKTLALNDLMALYQ